MGSGVLGQFGAVIRGGLLGMIFGGERPGQLGGGLDRRAAGLRGDGLSPLAALRLVCWR